MKEVIIMNKPTILQGFEWYIANDGSHWKHLASEAKKLSTLGFNYIWLPPASKGSGGKDDVGYGTYDLYDIGEFDQKGSVRTKYGTKSDYIELIKTLNENGIEALGDIVINHFLGADESEIINVQKYPAYDRTRPIGDSEVIEAWTKFTFPGRKGVYDDSEWNWTHFTGVDWDNRRKEHAIFKIEGKEWDDVDKEYGNYDYLMGADLDLDNREVVERLIKWGKWFIDTTGVDGFRLDAVKHINFTFFIEWLQAMFEHSGKEMFAVGEYWSDDLAALVNYLDSSGMMLKLFDVPLHFNLMNASNSNGAFNLGEMFKGTLVEARPAWAVTFVDNHDTQPGQSLQSWVNGWFKPLAYSLILLRDEGVPCVFYGDLYGIEHDKINPVGEQLIRLLLARKYCAYGDQVDYLDDGNVIGWVRTGGEKEHSGLAVVMTDGDSAEKRMNVGAWFGGRSFYDCTGNIEYEILIEEDGNGIFPVNGGSVSVWVPVEAKVYFEDVEDYL